MVRLATGAKRIQETMGDGQHPEREIAIIFLNMAKQSANNGVSLMTMWCTGLFLADVVLYGRCGNSFAVDLLTKPLKIVLHTISFRIYIHKKDAANRPNSSIYDFILYCLGFALLRFDDLCTIWIHEFRYSGWQTLIFGSSSLPEIYWNRTS